MQPRTLSREEEAELAWSNKKVKDINHAKFNGVSRANSPPLGNQVPELSVKTSFKDKLLGEIPGAFAQAFDLTDQMDEDVGSDDENGDASISTREGVGCTMRPTHMFFVKNSFNEHVIHSS